MAVKRPFRPNSLVPDIVPAKDSPLEGLNSQCEVGLRFFNGIRSPVTIIFRSGVELTVPPVLGVRSSSFFIRNVFKLDSSVIVDTRRLLDDGRHYETVVAKEYHQAFEKSITHRLGAFSQQEKQVDFELRREDFERNGGFIYLENLDILVSLLNPMCTPRHPMTVGAYADSILETDPALKDGHSFHYRITIVDSAQRFGSRFININGKVYHIPVVHDSKMADGVYFISSFPAQGAMDYQLPRVFCYDFEIAEKELGLWRTHNEAFTLGNPDSVMKRLFDTATHEANMALVTTKRESQERIAQLDQERREQEQEALRIKHSLTVREAALSERELEMRSKENEVKHRLAILAREQDILDKQYERGVLVRKERVEWLKVTPLVIGGIGAILAAIKALKSK